MRPECPHCESAFCIGALYPEHCPYDEELDEDDHE